MSPAAATKKKRRPGRPPRSSKAEEAARKVPEGVRVIKRYGNRRLYDTHDSQAITLQKLEAMVRRGEDLRVIDGDTGEDLTRRTLVQILLEEQNALQLDILPVEMLRAMIQARSHEAINDLQGFVRRMAGAFAAQWTNAGKAASELLRSMVPPPPPPPSASSEPLNDPMLELQRIQRQMAELTARMFGR